MSVWKLLITVVVLGAVALFAFDALSVLNAHRDVRDVASASASAAAGTISTSSQPTLDGVKAPSAATAAAAKKAADKQATAHGDVVTYYNYDPVTTHVNVTVSGNAKSFVLHYFDRNLTNNIKASAVAQPG
jgi:hypothetical protein